jgi:hypothetical protein
MKKNKTDRSRIVEYFILVVAIDDFPRCFLQPRSRCSDEGFDERLVEGMVSINK